ncbi:helix-turn-helix domain-containing protein [Burkholderiaceae bacterium DAT-1]|nr:helix-turn-helix domain-containing protein [Burkholderiaceae bacterium DAT-1]
MSIQHIAVVAFDHISPFHLSVPCVVFGDGLREEERFQLVVCGATPGPLRTTAGFTLDGLAPLDALRDASAIIIPSWHDVDARPPETLLEQLRDAHARGVQLVGLCLGAFVLAEAGLLDGRTATTHWAHATQMRERYPAISVDPDVLYVEDGNILTSAGTAAELDACLHLLRRQLGSHIANRVARRLVVQPHRDGGQAQFIEHPLPQTAGGSRLAHLLESVRQRLHDAHSLDSLADEARMSRRSFTRQFRALTGTTVQAWLLRERLTLAQQLLEKTGHSIERIAELAGFGSAITLRHHFRRAVGLSPLAWRKAFSDRN